MAGFAYNRPHKVLMNEPTSTVGFFVAVIQAIDLKGGWASLISVVALSSSSLRRDMA